jgi:hypothetical protein
VKAVEAVEAVIAVVKAVVAVVKAVMGKGTQFLKTRFFMELDNTDTNFTRWQKHNKSNNK